MSCYQVPTRHLNKMLASLRNGYGAGHGRPSELRVYRDGAVVCIGPWGEDATWQQAAELLWEWNRNAVLTRYAANHSDVDPGAYDAASYYDPAFVTVDPVSALKLCDGYEYQASDAPGYFAGIGHDLVDLIRRHNIKRLPGYEDADWECRDVRFDRSGIRRPRSQVLMA